jgi:hypothetical protein
MSIKAICSNSGNKPREIPKENWVVSGNEYTIHHIYKQMDPTQKGVQGCLLTEISLENLYKEGKTKHNCYRLDRFMFNKEDIQKLFDLIKECTELDDVDIKKELDSLITI